jgi:hypothetical protein
VSCFDINGNDLWLCVGKSERDGGEKEVFYVNLKGVLMSDFLA